LNTSFTRFWQEQTKKFATTNKKKTGGQQGHEGKNLQMANLPDEKIEHKQRFCKECGEELLLQDCRFETRKQEVVLPPALPRHIEHQSYSCTCKRCGAKTTTTFPERLKHPFNMEIILKH
jgi:transposase